MNKTNFKSNLYIGSLELTRYQDLLSKNILNFYEPFIVQYGLIITQDFSQVLSGQWKVTQADNFSINVAPGDAIVQDDAGFTARVKLINTQNIVMPSADGVYKVLLKHTYTNYEEGTISVINGSNVITGTGTEFTKLFGLNRLLIFGGQYYTVLQVNSDTELLITENYPGATASGINYAVGGWFTTPRIAVNDNLIYELDSKSIVITTANKASNEYWLAEVTMTGGIITNVVDKRNQNIFKIYSEVPKFDWQTARTRKVTLYRPKTINSGAVNADAATLSAQILADDTHVGTFQKKFGLRFYKTADDKTLTVNFTSTYTATGQPLTALDQVKWQVRIDIDGQATGNAYYLDTNEAVYDISALPDGYYTMYFLLKKVSTAFGLSVMINEVALKGNLNIVIQG